MSLPLTTQRMTRPLLMIAAAVVLLAFSIWGSTRGVAAAIGAGLSLANWFALRFLVGRLIAGSGSNAVLSLLLIAKIGVLMGVVFLLINRIGVDPLGLAFGLGVLFVGPVLAGLSLSTNSDLSVSGGVSAQTSPVHSSAVRSAREER